jgi:glutathione peroxidase
MKIKTIVACFVATLMCSALVAQETAEVESASALGFTMQTLGGEDVELSKYEGKVILFVNVASKCGLTPQYEALQALHDEYAEAGLAIVGVPCNQFGGQEPGSSDEIETFCQENYGVKFDMLAKVNVNGDEQCELYKMLTPMDLAPKGSGDVSWNFEKFLIDRNGKPIARFGPRTKPNSDDLVGAIKKALEAEVDSGTE